MSVLVLAWAGCLILVPASIGEQILGETWTVSRSILPWVVTEQVVWALATGPISLLSAYRRWRMLLTVRVVYLGAVACALALTVPTGEIEWVMSGMVAAAVTNCVILWLASRRLHRELPASEPVSGQPSERTD
ncbi:hypothetical protein ACNKF0_20945 [Nocardioides sp. T5]|uniref:hypothetical protein n=1 Tax=Nocardioides sp. T5 TaxID=3400182 RepID=UPI003A8B4EF2